MKIDLNDYSNAFVLITNGKHAGHVGFVESIHDFKGGRLGVVSSLGNGDRFEALIAPEDVRLVDYEDSTVYMAAIQAAKWFYRYDIRSKCDYCNTMLNSGKTEGELKHVFNIITKRQRILDSIRLHETELKSVITY